MRHPQQSPAQADPTDPSDPLGAGSHEPMPATGWLYYRTQLFYLAYNTPKPFDCKECPIFKPP